MERVVDGPNGQWSGQVGIGEVGFFGGVWSGDGVMDSCVVSWRVALFNSRVVSSLTSGRDSTRWAESVFGKGGASRARSGIAKNADDEEIDLHT